MARINIEDSVFKDNRFIKLCIKTGDQQKALGALVWAFIIAQKFYLDESNDRLIPLNEWQRNECNDLLLEVGLVEKRENGFYVCGSENQFKWLVQRSEAGKKGGGSNRIKRQKKATVVEREATVEQPLSLSLSLSPSLSHSLTHSLSQKNISQKKLKTPTAAQNKSEQSNLVISLYFNLWKEKYIGKAPLTGKHFSLLKGVVKTNGVERTSELLKAYFEMPDAWFIKRRHDVESFNANLNQIAHYADTGTVITNQQVRQADSQMTNQQLLKSYEGKNENEK